MAHGDALATATEEARQLCRDNDLDSAHAVLRDALAAVPDWAQDADTAAATRLYASVLTALGEVPTAEPWAARAYGTCLDVLGATHPETLAAAATLASVLRTLGSNTRAGHLYAYLADTLSTVEGRRSPAALAARADLATVLHVQGDCERARSILAEAHAEHEETYGDGDPATIKMVARLGRMARDCGDFLAAHEHFDEARAACRRHLGPDHPLTAAVTALVHAPADPAHACGQAPDEPPDPQPTNASQRPNAHQRSNPTGSGNGSATWAAVRRQPVRSARPAPRNTGRMTTRVLLLVTVAVLLVAAGAGAVALGRTRAGPSVGPAPTGLASPTGAVPGPPAAAPREIRLTDRGTSVVLTWLLPPGAEGPLFVSGASGGSPPRPFQTLLPGSTIYTIHGLNPRLDYCFVLTLVYSTDVTAGTEPVCTQRGTTPTGTPSAQR